MQQVSQSPLKFLRYAIEEFNVQAPFPSSPEEFKNLNFAHEQNVNYFSDKNDPNIVRVDMQLSMKAENTKLFYNLKLSGFFAIEEKDENLKAALITNGAPTILYGIAREIILSFSFKTIYPPVVLQPVFFNPQQAQKETKDGF